MVMESKQSRVFRLGIIHIVFIIISLMCIIPFITVVSISFSTETDITNYGYSILPRNFTLTAYNYIVKNPMQILQSYKISFVFTFVGTLLSVYFMAMASYCLARSNFKYRRVIMFYIFFTMLFSGGMVPSYILVSQYLHLNDTIWALILPGLVNVFHVVLLRTFFQKLPSSLFESAKLDGASEFRIFLVIAIPLSTPVLATVSLLGALGRWNDWFNALLYINRDDLMPLQYLLYRIMADLQFISSMRTQDATSSIINAHELPNETARMAMCVLAAGPMMFIFPFFQKYFVQGLTVGSIKG